MAEPALDFRNVNTLWSSVFAETLALLGLELAVLCPGSRSSPLTIAFANHPDIETIPILDERSAAFFALGRAKRSQQPVVLVCTSGTAAANFFPAIIEATESQVPLLVLTSDRPPELRHCHAGQTIDQIKLYGNYPQWQTELALPSSELDFLAYLRQTLVYAWERCCYPRSGVVHLNCPFREPLAPVPQTDILALATTFPLANFFAAIKPKNHKISLTQIDYLPDFPEKGVIIAGLYQGQEAANYCQAIALLFQKLEYPVLSDALSPLRNFVDGSYSLITNYDFLLRNEKWARALEPDCVIQIGELPTSKQLRIWLSQLDCPRYILEPSPDNFDPLQGKTEHLRCSIDHLLNYLLTLAKKTDISKDYYQTWQNLDHKIKTNINRAMQINSDLFEGKIAWLLSQILPPKTLIFIANSMPIRYLEFFWQCNQNYYQPYFNRGANGIDGTLSTALGIAHQASPAVLLTGDLSLLHDTNAFLIYPYFQGSLTIILINNNGGGIFEMLAIADNADERELFENYFATPQNIDFAQLCATYNIDYQQVTTENQFNQLLNPLPQTGIRLLEIKCDRQRDAHWLKIISNQFVDQV